MADFVLDSYAVLALLTDDVGADQVADLLSQSEHIFWMSVVNLGEVYYIVSRAQSQEDAESVVSDILHQDNVTIVDATWDRVRTAAQFKAHGRLSYADAFACTVASEYDTEVVTGDPEFSGVEGITVHWLPSKGKPPSTD